jgi:hypothetical protein
MNTPINDGGPAFPQQLPDAALERGTPGMYGAAGMTLRDYFAATALQGQLACMVNQDPETRAKEAYRFADAMIAERNKPQS